MGVVYRARHGQLGVERAVKVIRAANAKARNRLEREARALAAIQDPHVVRIHEIGHSGGSLWFSMDLLEGEPLDAVLEGDRLDRARALQIACDMCRGVATLHRAGIVHRDLKPANVFLTADGRALILDLGLALRADDGDERLTKSGAMIGTVLYMAPEQLRAERSRCGPPTDVFALGLILYELLTGEPARDVDPSAGMAVFTVVLQSHGVRPAARCPELPAKLDDLVRRATHQDPAGRPASAVELLDELERVRAAPGPSRRARLQRLAAVALTALTMLVVGAALALHEARAHRTPPSPLAPSPTASATPSPSPTERPTLQDARSLRRARDYARLLGVAALLREDPQPDAKGQREVEDLFWRASQAQSWGFKVGQGTQVAFWDRGDRLVSASNRGGRLRVEALVLAGQAAQAEEPSWTLGPFSQPAVAACAERVVVGTGSLVHVLEIGGDSRQRDLGGRIRQVACSPSGETLAVGLHTASGGGQGYVLRASDLETVAELGPLECPLTMLRYVDERRLVCATEHEDDAELGQLLDWRWADDASPVELARLVSPRCLDARPGLDPVAVGSSLGEVHLYGPGRESRSLESDEAQQFDHLRGGPRAHGGTLRGVVFLPGARRLVSLASESDRRLGWGELRVWDLEGRELWHQRLEGAKLVQLRLAPDASRVLMVSEDGRVQVWPLRAP
jgi:serine/threonine-protein kinase